MKSKVNLKVLEQSLKLASKAADLERQYQDSDLSQLLHEVNLMALGIPRIVSGTETAMAEKGVDPLMAVIEEIRLKIASVSERSEAIFEFARLLDLESELVRQYQGAQKDINRPVKASRLSLKDRSRVVKPLQVRTGFQTSLF
ncbi:hypothetical protein [Roseivirga sp.]|uniref:hypothetical protein n=1 Tax=Roseivirga sp. TaxID=1964215 RepID=UPI003B51C734